MSRDIQTPGPSEQLEARYGVKGAIALRLDEVVIPVEVIRAPALRPAVGRVTSGGVSTFQSECAITAVNPVSRAPRLIEVTKLHVSLINTAGRFFLRRPSAGIAGFSNVTTKGWKNFGEGISPTAVIAFKNSAAVTAGVDLMFFWLAAINVTHTVDLLDSPIILGLNGFNDLIVRPDGLNLGIRVVFEWREPAVPI